MSKQILRGSHKCGRIDHGPVAGQTMANMDRVNELMKVFPLEYVELQPGTYCDVFNLNMK